MPRQEAAIEVDDKGAVNMYGLIVIEAAADARDEGSKAKRGKASEAFDCVDVGVLFFRGKG